MLDLIKDYVRERFSKLFSKSDQAAVILIGTLAFWLIGVMLPEGFGKFVFEWANSFLGHVPAPVYVILLISISAISIITIKALLRQVSQLHRDQSASHGSSKSTRIVIDAVGNPRIQYQLSYPTGTDLKTDSGKIEAVPICKEHPVPLFHDRRHESFNTIFFWRCEACQFTLQEEEEAQLRAKTVSSFVKTR